MTQITIAALVMTDWTGNGLRDGDTWRYTFTATLQPQTRLDDQLVPIGGSDLRLLTEHSGLQTQLRTDVVYPAGEDGSAPASSTVGPAMLGWAQAAVAAAIERWVGQTVRLTVEAAT